MGRKADLQAELTAAGIPFLERMVISRLEALLAEADKPESAEEIAAAVLPPADPEVDPRFPDLSTEADKPEGREARRQARRDEAALAALNRANDVAEAKAKVRTAAQQALDRAGDST